ncbi:MAG TPA: GAF domain-containing protein [Ktedonobacterales bacterium]|nr:GAF domain-containing protein [Ktedonobacterales bacterium]
MLNVYRPVPTDLLSANRPVLRRRALRFLLTWYDAIAGTVTAIIAVLLVTPILTRAPWMALWPLLYVIYQLGVIALSRHPDARPIILGVVRALIDKCWWLIFGPPEPQPILGSGAAAPQRRDDSRELALLHGALACALTVATFLFVVSLDRASASAGRPIPLLGAGWLLFVLPVLRAARYASVYWIVGLGAFVIICDAAAWALAAGRVDGPGAWIIALHACWLTLISLLPAVTLRSLSERRADLTNVLDITRAITALTITHNPSETAFANQAATIIAERMGYDEVNILLATSEDARIARGLRFYGASSPTARKLVVEGFVIDETQGITGWCANNRQMRMVNDVAHDPGHLYLPHPMFPNTRAELAIPLILGETLLGVLDVQSERAYAFSDDDVELLNAIALHLAVSLDSVRRLTRAQGLTAVTQRIARRLLAQQELRPALEEIVGIARETLDADSVALYPRHLDDGRIGEPVTAGEFTTRPASAARIALRGEESAVERALREGAARFERYETGSHRHRGFVAREEVRAAAILPLRAGASSVSNGDDGQTNEAAALGVIFVNYRAPRLFPPEYREWCAALADLAALALQSAMLYQHVAEEERANTWHEIHDGMAQHASVGRWLIEQIASEWERTSALGARGGEKLLTAREAIRALQRQVNYLIEIWRERDTADIWRREDERAPLDRPRFFAELDDYASLVRRALEVDCAPRCSGDDRALSISLRHDALMIVREAVNNASRHGRATHIEITARVEDGALTLIVSDNGCGFDTSHISKSHGINGIRARVERCGGVFSLESSREQGASGTMLTLLLPLSAANASENSQPGERGITSAESATSDSSQAGLPRRLGASDSALSVAQNTG